MLEIGVLTLARVTVHSHLGFIHFIQLILWTYAWQSIFVHLCNIIFWSTLLNHYNRWAHSCDQYIVFISNIFITSIIAINVTYQVVFKYWLWSILKFPCVKNIWHGPRHTDSEMCIRSYMLHKSWFYDKLCICGLYACTSHKVERTLFERIAYRMNSMTFFLL